MNGSTNSLSDNPFAALFPSLEQAEMFCAAAALINTPDSTRNQDDEALLINAFLERVFLVTLDCNGKFQSFRPGSAVYLEDLNKTLGGETLLSFDNLSQFAFERLLIAEPKDFIITRTSVNEHTRETTVAAQSCIIDYLSETYLRLQKDKTDNKVPEAWVTKCENVLVDNGKLALQMPQVFGDVDTRKQLTSILLRPDVDDKILVFLDKVCLAINDNPDEGLLKDVVLPTLKKMKSQTNNFNLGQISVHDSINTAMFFTRSPTLAMIFLEFISNSTELKNGRSYQDTLLGRYLTVSCLPREEIGPYQFFDKPSGRTKQDHDITEANIHQPTGNLNDHVHQLIYAFIKLGGEPRHRILEWICDCLQANKDRAKIWSRQMPQMFGAMFASDGFFVNLCAVLLRLSKPFSIPDSPRLLKIDASYIRATQMDQIDRRQMNIHCSGLQDETKLISTQEDETGPQLTQNYNFVSECFFITHRALNLGIHVLQERFMKLNQDLHRVQGVFQDIVRQGAVNTEPGQRIKEQMEKGMTVFLSMKAALTEPKLLEYCLDFFVASSSYLTQAATNTLLPEYHPVKFPLPDEPTTTLKCLPEFIAENILDFMLFARRFKDSLYEMEGERLSPLMTFILVFMGSPQRMMNPHLRAHMAEALEGLMPPKDGKSSAVSSHFYREQVFTRHDLINELAPTLLHVFVSIEMTGQGVEFEQKFNYRRPMYNILEYIWSIRCHKSAIKLLADEAEAHLEDPDPPLFLRFSNLLVNDAIFLLDEAFSYMMQIKEKQTEQESGEWASLPANQRQEQEGNLRQLTMLARFHNMMGLDTIRTLQFLTVDIRSFFMHDVMLERIVAMLNYFLVNLVGPKSKQLKVKDFTKYEFKPQEVVQQICRIYLNFAEYDKFCLAVTSDGRSYNPQLFQQAEAVLVKIHASPELISSFLELGQKINAASERQKAEEEAFADAPDEFLDAILGTLMKDPVKLPSGNIVDRSTIARHILSDQTDPFNRQPLTMDMVESYESLRKQIEDWKKNQGHINPPDL